MAAPYFVHLIVGQQQRGGWRKNKVSGVLWDKSHVLTVSHVWGFGAQTIDRAQPYTASAYGIGHDNKEFGMKLDSEPCVDKSSPYNANGDFKISDMGPAAPDVVMFRITNPFVVEQKIGHVKYMCDLEPGKLDEKQILHYVPAVDGVVHSSNVSFSQDPNNINAMYHADAGASHGASGGMYLDQKGNPTAMLQGGDDKDGTTYCLKYTVIKTVLDGECKKHGPPILAPLLILLFIGLAIAFGGGT